MPEFTTSKWGCVIEGFRPLLSALQGKHSPLARFFDKCRELYCGTLETKSGERSHPHKEKILTISGTIEKGTLQAGVYAIVDIWDKRFDDFFKLCKGDSRYGGFPQPHCRHMLAEQVASDTVFYREARRDAVSAVTVLNPRVSGEYRLYAGSGGR